MKVKRDTITGLVGLTWSVIWFILIQVQTTQPANLLEPGPRLLPYVGLIVVFLSSLMLNQGLEKRSETGRPLLP